MTSAQIRQSFLDFFRSKQHTIVPSASLMPDSPNLLFTNAGMNQFVPIFLGERKPDVSKWAGVTPGLDTRAADTQKCIRAGGKHNDLDDVGLDTYHHTFFEMLGNWSFGDYFKQEAIEWAWELVIERWKFPPQRLYATIYQPDKAKGDPSERDEEAWGHWAAKFRSVGLDPAVHIVNGGKKDNFWMMGDTGPCGPCSELHVDLTPAGDTHGRLVNQGTAECIEIWNLVFIQYNANPDGSFTPLPAKHVDTGMGFERVTSIIQGTKGLTDFANAKISNYETDIFRPIFDELEKLSGRKYGSTLPTGEQVIGASGSCASGISSGTGAPPVLVQQAPSPAEADLSGTRQAKAPVGPVTGGGAGATTATATAGGQVALDIAFRVIADHIRTLSFAIADGIQPGNTDRNYVLRRILRRAVRYGRTLSFHEPFFYKLVDVLAETMGEVFPEIRTKRQHVKDVIRVEEEAFNRTLDRGIELFCNVVERQQGWVSYANELERSIQKEGTTKLGLAKFWASVLRAPATPYDADPCIRFFSDRLTNCLRVFERSKSVGELLATVADIKTESKQVSGRASFVLYDTYGFPLDLTELMARERGLTVDVSGFNQLMDEQKARARAAQKKQVIELSQIETKTPTRFVGFDTLESEASVLEVVRIKDKHAVILDSTAFYAEMGGQVGDSGWLTPVENKLGVVVTNTIKSGSTCLHLIDEAEQPEDLPEVGSRVTTMVDWKRRPAIERHHTVTHLLHWALHEVVSRDASQKGSFVGPDKLTFDFNCAPLTSQQVADVEKLVNERIVENTGVSWIEVPHADVKSRKDVLQFFGEKYGDTVRVVQIGGHAQQLDGYSMELCGGTHTRSTGEIGLFRIVAESAIAAGVRRIEAVAGLSAYDAMKLDRELIKTVAGRVNAPIHELDKKIDALLAHQKELERQLKIAQQRNASNAASELVGRAHTVNGIPLITHNLGDTDADFLQATVDALKSRFKGVIVLGGGSEVSVALVAAVSPEFTAKVQAGKLIQAIAPIVGGKGGGKPDNARGGGKDVTKLDEALAKVKTLL